MKMTEDELRGLPTSQVINNIQSRKIAQDTIEAQKAVFFAKGGKIAGVDMDVTTEVKRPFVSKHSFNNQLKK